MSWMTTAPYDASTASIKPYLELPHLISLAWLAYPILSLLFIAFRLQASASSSQDAVASAKDNLLRSCLAAEKAATSTASMPRFMAVATNAQIADAVNGTLNAARATLVLSLTVMETVINFIIDLYRSTFLCFLELVVRGGLSILISAVKEVTDFIEKTLGDLRTTIQNDISSVNSAIQSAIDGINKINPFDDIKAPQFDIPSLNALANVSIPTDFEDALVKLNASLPTVDELKGKVEDLIDTPFELLKKEINDTFANITFNGSTLPVPQQNTVQFCADLDTSVIDDLGQDLLKAATIGSIILVVLALLLFAGSAALEWYKWRSLKQHLQYTREAWSTDPTLAHAAPAPNGVPSMQMTDHNLLTLHAASAHPLLTRITNQLSALFRLSPQAHTRTQWFFAYVFHPPALACFLIGFFGILSVQIQLAAIGPLAEQYKARAADTASDFSATIAASLNDSMYNQSAAYAADINARVDAIQSSLDGGVFGWINTTTVTLNTTLAGFYDEVQGAVTTVFGGTILEQPAQEFIRCLIGTKVEALENALTFLHDNIIVELPRMNNSALVLDPQSVQDATKPIALAAIGDSSSDGKDDGGIVGKLVRAYVASLEKERLMFAVFLALWGVVVLMAICILLWTTRGKPYMERRRRARWVAQERAGVATFADERGYGAAAAAPRGSNDTLTGSAHDEKVVLQNFTPLPTADKKSFFNHLSDPAPAAPELPSEKRKTFIPGIPKRKPAPAELNVNTPDDAPEPAGQTPAWLRRLTSYWHKDGTPRTGDITPYPAESWAPPSPPPVVQSQTQQAPPSPRLWEKYRSTPEDLPVYQAQVAPTNPFAMPIPLHHGFASPPSSPAAHFGQQQQQQPSPMSAESGAQSPVYALQATAAERTRQMRAALGGPTMSPARRMAGLPPPPRHPQSAPRHVRAPSGDPFATPFDNPRAL